MRAFRAIRSIVAALAITVFPVSANAHWPDPWGIETVFDGFETGLGKWYNYGSSFVTEALNAGGVTVTAAEGKKFAVIPATIGGVNSLVTSFNMKYGSSLIKYKYGIVSLEFFSDRPKNDFGRVELFSFGGFPWYFGNSIVENIAENIPRSLTGVFTGWKQATFYTGKEGPYNVKFSAFQDADNLYPSYLVIDEVILVTPITDAGAGFLPAFLFAAFAISKREQLSRHLRTASQTAIGRMFYCRKSCV